jgi:peroxiredoxin
MAAVPSNMVPLGTPAPTFRLKSTQGDLVSIKNFADARALLIIFMCNHCPYMKHLHKGLVELANDYIPKGVAILGINSNDTETHPEDSFERMQEEVQRVGYPFPYLFDESQEVAQAYFAMCTPDFFLFNDMRELIYRGQFDASRPGNGVPVTGSDIRAALDAYLEGREVLVEQKPSLGCNIKWKPGNEPEYYRLGENTIGK